MRHGDRERPVVRNDHSAMQRNVIVRRGDGMIRRHHGINRHADYRRIGRGLALPQHWWGPRFHVTNWGNHGLPQPMHGGRWVRYFDDALLVDRYGRVHDGRWGMSWDDYDDQWDYDDRGIPVYVGNGDYHPDDEDYAWVDGRQGPAGAYGYGPHQQAYGYPAYGYGGGMIVTETTVTTSPTVVVKTVYEDVVPSAPQRSYRAKSKSRRISSKARCHC
jgi:Ni/Co efflux regulator RcnB